MKRMHISFFLQKSNEIKKVNKKYKYILKKITTKNTYIKYINIIKSIYKDKNE